MSCEELSDDFVLLSASPPHESPKVVPSPGSDVVAPADGADAAAGDDIMQDAEELIPAHAQLPSTATRGSVNAYTATGIALMAIIATTRSPSSAFSPASPAGTNSSACAVVGTSQDGLHFLRSQLGATKAALSQRDIEMMELREEVLRLSSHLNYTMAVGAKWEKIARAGIEAHNTWKKRESLRKSFHRAHKLSKQANSKVTVSGSGARSWAKAHALIEARVDKQLTKEAMKAQGKKKAVSGKQKKRKRCAAKKQQVLKTNPKQVTVGIQCTD